MSHVNRRAGAYGASVCIIDRGARYEGKERIGAGFGGTCVNVGCIPKKMMWTAAMHREIYEGPTATAANNGFLIEGKLKFDWATLKANRDAYITKISSGRLPNWERTIAKYKKGRVIVGTGSFVDKNTVAVTAPDGNVVHVKGKHIVIATGGRPVFPPNTPGAEEYGYTSDNFWDIKTQPKKAAVIGAGYIAGMIICSARRVYLWRRMCHSFVLAVVFKYLTCSVANVFIAFGGFIWNAYICSDAP